MGIDQIMWIAYGYLFIHASIVKNADNNLWIEIYKSLMFVIGATAVTTTVLTLILGAIAA